VSPSPRVRTPLARLAVLVAGAFLAVTVGVFAHPASAAAWSAGSFSAASASQLLQLTNQARASAGLRALKSDSTLTSIARWRSKDMIERDYFSHSIPGSGSVFDVLQAKGYCFRVAGENIGWNSYPDDAATQAVHLKFMDSSGHRANILGKAWDVVGIGAYKGPTGKKMWTVLFADKCGGAAAATPKPKPKPTPKPAAPRATPKPAAPRATPRPTPKAAPRPTPVATPEPTPTPEPPDRSEPDDDAPRGLAGVPIGTGNGDGTGAISGNGGPGGAGPPAGQSYRVDDPAAVPAASPGLLDGLAGALLRFLFGA
jgi:uncharacterized protein YkwD